MSIQDKNPTPIPNPRLSDPMTAGEGVEIYNKLVSLSKRAEGIELKFVDLLEILARIDAGLSLSREGRLAAELRETEIERDLLEKQLRAVDEKIHIKREVKNNAPLDTQERIQTVAASTYATIEDKKKAEREKKIEELKWGTIKAVVGALSVGGTLSFVGLIWWLIQLYANRGGP